MKNRVPSLIRSQCSNSWWLDIWRDTCRPLAKVRSGQQSFIVLKLSDVQNRCSWSGWLQIGNWMSVEADMVLLKTYFRAARQFCRTSHKIRAIAYFCRGTLAQGQYWLGCWHVCAIGYFCRGTLVQGQYCLCYGHVCTISDFCRVKAAQG